MRMSRPPLPVHPVTLYVDMSLWGTADVVRTPVPKAVRERLQPGDRVLVAIEFPDSVPAQVVAIDDATAQVTLRFL